MNLTFISGIYVKVKVPLLKSKASRKYLRLHDLSWSGISCNYALNFVFPSTVKHCNLVCAS